jgi:Zn-dependent protease
VGRVAGAPVVVTPSWFIAAVVLTLFFAPTVRYNAPGLQTTSVLVIAFAFVLLLFASVFLHEVAHALMARRRGHHVTELAVTLLGGHTAYTGAVRRPADGALVAAVGPLTNVLLAALFWLLYQVQPVASIPALLLYAAAFSNAFVAVFNLLPGLPLDGGQILESLVWAITGSRARGTVAAGWIGRVVAVGVLAWALLWPLLEGREPSLVTVMWSALVGAFLWSGAGAAMAGGRRREALAGISVRGLAAPAVVVPVGASVADAAAAVTGVAGAAVVVVDTAGVALGWVDPAAAAAVPPDLRRATAVEAVLVPFEPGSSAEAALAGQDLLAHLARVSRGARFLPVVDDGRVTGVLDVARVAAALRGRS